jgi:ATP/maltotriose-dependent transcriptional regulator MalT
MQARESWKEHYTEFTEAVTHLAHTTIRKWMVGVDLDDVKQSIWAEFFRICEQDTENFISKTGMLEQLRHYASTLKREEGERKFGQRKVMNETAEFDVIGNTNMHWRKVRHLWEEYVGKQSQRDGIILRFAAQGTSNEHIAAALKLSVQAVKNRRSILVQKFREEVENSVQIDKSL